MTLTSEPIGEHEREILLIGHTAARAAVRCDRCTERTASWQLRDVDGNDRSLCPYCAALETEVS